MTALIGSTLVLLLGMAVFSLGVMLFVDHRDSALWFLASALVAAVGVVVTITGIRVFVASAKLLELF